jgi:hypothetical protein
MNHCIKTGLLTLALGTAFMAAESQAALQVYGSAANGPGRCQAFTPGVTNTIRNRVVGSENIGDNPLAVACAFETEFSTNSTDVLEVQVWFSNNTAAQFDVSCTMLNGFQGEAGAIAVNKVTQVAAGNNTAGVAFAGADLPGAPADLGNILVGVNCTLPKGAVINDTYTFWADEDGVPPSNP